jgi:hypothetical protein
VNAGQRLALCGFASAFVISLATTIESNAIARPVEPTPFPTLCCRQPTIVYPTGIFITPGPILRGYLYPGTKKTPEGTGYVLRREYYARTTPSGVVIIEKKSGRIVTRLRKSSGVLLR